MGLDIYLIRLSHTESDKNRFLHSEDSPELVKRFPEMELVRLNRYQDETGSFEFGFYHDELAYQRKGVIKDFYQRYKDTEFLFEIHEIDELFNYISPDYKDSFQSDFVSRFSESDTILMIDG